MGFRTLWLEMRANVYWDIIKGAAFFILPIVSAALARLFGLSLIWSIAVFIVSAFTFGGLLYLLIYYLGSKQEPPEGREKRQYKIQRLQELISERERIFSKNGYAPQIDVIKFDQAWRPKVESLLSKHFRMSQVERFQTRPYTEVLQEILDEILDESSD